MYIPRILLCGDREKFLQKMNGRLVEIIGQISFKGAYERGELKFYFNLNDLLEKELKPEDFQIFWDGMEISFEQLKNFLDGGADYIVFENSGEFCVRFNELYLLKINERLITADNLLKYAGDNFHSMTNASALVKSLYKLKISRLLDLDNFFNKIT